MKMHYFYSIISVFALFQACHTKKEVAAATVPAAKEKQTNEDANALPIGKSFLQLWLHSREEDKDGTMTYRPADGSFSFPPSRGGRYGYRFEKGGKGVMTYPGPTDATETKPLMWQMLDKNGGGRLDLQITENDNTVTNKKFKLVELSETVLRLIPLDK